MKKIVTLIFLLLSTFAFLLNAQSEFLAPLLENSIIIQNNKKEKTKAPELRTTAITSLNLPFSDDFYPNNIYPDASLWEDSNVYINMHYPINSISLGVATFDGLDKNGLPYSTNSNTIGIADFLTSKPIDLSSLDASANLYLSFYFQAKGNGQSPEDSDKLLVDFLHPTNGWTEVWQSPNVDSALLVSFRKVFISVEESFFSDTFRFRFKNIARLSGNNDHWHIDYVELDRDRNPIIEQNLPDVSYQSAEGSILKRYFVMPYNLIDSSEIADSHSVVVKNNFPLSAVDIIDRYSAKLTVPNLPIINFSGSLDFLSSQQVKTYNYSMFDFPQNITEDTVSLEILYQFSVSLEDSLNPLIIRNNNLTVIQEFGNYFAYDDGTPERAYQLEYGNSSEGSLAVQYFTPKPTILRGVRFHVANNNTNLNNTLFSIQVWKQITKGENSEDELLYNHPNLNINDLTKEFSNGLNDYYVYALDSFWIQSSDTVVSISDSFYIGITVTRLGNESLSQLPLGFDVNRSSKGSNYFKFPQDNVWLASSFDGSIIFNPIVGKRISNEYLITSLLESNIQEVRIYPNPATDKIRISDFNTDKIRKARIYSIDGRIAKEQLIETEGLIDVLSLQQGFYIIEFYDQNDNVHARARFIKSNGR